MADPKIVEPGTMSQVRFEEQGFGRKELISVEEARWAMLTYTEADGKPRRRLAVTFPNGNLFLIPPSDISLENPSKWLVREFRSKVDEARSAMKTKDD